MKNKIRASFSVVILICIVALGLPSVASASDDAIDGGTIPAVLTTITVSPVNPSVVFGQTEQFSAQGLDQDGDVITGVVFTWSIAGSQSDAGAIDSSTGVFTAGTISGNYTDAIEAKSDNITGTASVMVTPANLSITTVSLADGQEGIDYYQTLAAADGTPPYTWSITDGSLPDGLYLAGDIIYGMPTTAGTFSFTVAVTDSASPLPGTITGYLSITISPEPPTTAFIVRLVAGLSAATQQQVIARNGGVETSSVPVLKIHFIKVPNSSIDEVLQCYRSDPQVRSIEYDTQYKIEETPSDPSYPSQWALPMIAWDSVFGSVYPAGSSVIAILDTGIDASHPDLNGLVLPGYSAFEGSDAWTDPNGHGTKMAGITAALTNNGIGVAGVAYAGVSLLPIQVLGADGRGQDSDVINGIIWAVESGADVILMAFSNPDYSLALQEAIDYAWDNGVILVAAAGNEGLNTVTYPAGDRGVIGVSATDPNDALFPGSNYGQFIFLAAPGVNLLTTGLNGEYTIVSGTSAAAAMVAGAAAFMRAVDPGLSNGVIVGRLARTADPAGTQEQTGNGRLNMSRALSDTGTDPVQPEGAAPVGDGGPFIGPYVASGIITSTAAGGNWNVGSTWVGGVAPLATDSVIIATTGTSTVRTNGNRTCAGITINAGSIFYIGNYNRLTVNGSVDGSGQFTLGGTSSRLTFTGDWNFSGTYSSASRLTVTISGDTDQTIASTAVATWRGIIVDKSGGTLFISMTPTISSTTTLTAGDISYNRDGDQSTLSANHPGNLTLEGSGVKTLRTGITTIAGDLTLGGTVTTTTVVGLTISGNLIIGDGTTFNVANYNITVTGTTTIGDGTSGNLVFTSTAGTEIFVGLVTVNPNGTWDNSVNEAVYFRGGISNSGTFTAGTAIQTFNTNSQTLTGTLSIPRVTVTGVTLTNDGTLTVDTALAGTGGLTNNTDATLNIGDSGTISITTLTATAAGNTVNYYYAGAQTVKAVDYYNLTLSGSGAKTMTGVTTIGGDLTISDSATMTGNAGFTVTGALNYESGGTTTLTASTPISIGKFNQTAGTLVDNGNTITVTGTGANTWTKSGGTFTATGTVIFTGAAPQIGASNFENLTINVGNGNTATLTGAITVSGTLTINSNTTLADGGYVVTANGNVANSGTHSGDGEIYLAGGAASHSLSGSGIYGNLELDDSNGASLTGSPTISGALNLTSGALSIGANTLTLNDAVSHTSGSLTGGASSNIIFGGSGASTTLRAVTLNNLTINRANGISLGGAVTVGGTLTLTSGTLTVGANTLALNGPTIAGTPSNLGTTSSSSLSFGGSSAGVNIPSSVTALNNLTINNSNGITLNSFLTINGVLTFTSGNILAGSYAVIIPPGGTVSRTSGHVIGNLMKNVALGATSRTFEVGTASAYNPVTVVFGSVTTAGDLIVKVTSGQHSNNGTCLIDSGKDVNEYWSLMNSGIVFDSCDVTFNFVAGDILGGANPNNFIVGQYDSGWTYPTVGTKTATSTQAIGITSFGDFCVGEMIVPPTVNSVTLVDNSMTPQLEHTVTVNIGNIYGTSTLDTLVLKLWFDSSGSDHLESTFDGMSPDTQECAIITWTQSTDSFVIEPSSSTTWALGVCSSPGSLPGDFIFRFTVGKVATATDGSARWQVAAKVSNKVGQTDYDYDSTPPTMNWYGEVSINTVSIIWSSTISLGSGFTDNTTNRITDISVTYICNGNYNIRVKASSLWSGDGMSITLANNDTPGYGEFALKADDDDTLDDAVLVLSTDFTTFYTGTQTDEDGNTVASNSLWLKLGASGIPSVVLSGTIYYEITSG